jgi:hypothetical protein
MEKREKRPVKRPLLSQFFKDDKATLWPSGEREKPLHSTLAEFKRGKSNG